VHGALQTGALTTTFTASQGLLLMIPNMYKIAGELTPTVFHVAAARWPPGLSIFGDHSDVMAVRQTGFGPAGLQLGAGSHGLGADRPGRHAEARVPFLHFFDGFRTSHEVQKIEQLTDDDMRAMIDDELVRAHRARASRPTARSCAAPPEPRRLLPGPRDGQPLLPACPASCRRRWTSSPLTGPPVQAVRLRRRARRRAVIVLMGSGAETAHETVEYLVARARRSACSRCACTGRSRSSTSSPPCRHGQGHRRAGPHQGAGRRGEPLYQDVVTPARAGHGPSAHAKVIGGRYGLSSKEFTPAMVKAVFDELAKPKPKNHFTVGIVDDVTHTSLDYDPAFSTERPDVVRAMFYGLGADGTVGANKNSIKIIGEDTDNYAQGYFVYDSKKSGAVTVSHLRFGPEPIRSTYLITKPTSSPATSSPSWSATTCWSRPRPAHLPAQQPLRPTRSGTSCRASAAADHRQEAQVLRDRRLRGGQEDRHGRRINTIMQTCFFAISGVLPSDEAIAAIKDAIKKTYGKRGEAVVQQNFAAVDATLATCTRSGAGPQVTSTIELRPRCPARRPTSCAKCSAPIIAGKGDPAGERLPGRRHLPHRHHAVGEAQHRPGDPGLGPELCIQCGKCVLVCPHAVIRIKVYDPAAGRRAGDLQVGAGPLGKEFKA
jgi:pyruvate-ferredoxin/flavodoxin oxidoreductase